MYNIVKPFNIRWDWGRYRKQAQNVTMTTLWAATTTHRHTENLSEKIRQYLPMDMKRKEGTGSKNSYSYCKVKAAVSKMIDFSESTVKLLEYCKCQRPPYND